MVETHTRILGIAPYDGMRTAMEQAAQAYPNVELEVYTGDLEEGQAIVQRMAPNSYDCIISRGGTARMLRKHLDLPVIDIEVSAYDELCAFKLAAGLSDTPVTLAAKSLLRVGCPVVVAVSTNDGLGASGENIARLRQRKHYYFVPYGQDDPLEKPQSLKADLSLLPAALEAALQGRQLQPMLRMF